ncbi:MAG TPA: hypothetical protein VG713_22620 [Pirellulales bacterium]|nr:hypothetical protein [Pirellulales bacterium]
MDRCLVMHLSFILVVTGTVQAAEPSFQPVKCDGTYKQHLQGVCTGEDSIFWCFTSQLVKTDRNGKVLKQIPVQAHHGDLCFHSGKVFVAVNFGTFNRAEEQADSWVYVYSGDDLSLVTKHSVPEVVYGAGGIAYHDGKFIVVGGLPPGFEENYAYEYDEQFMFVKKNVVTSGYTLMGIQTAAFADGYWWFGCYGDPKILLKVDESFEKVGRFEFDCSLGIVPVTDRQFLVARGTSSKDKGCTGRLSLAQTDPKQGLTILDGD